MYAWLLTCTWPPHCLFFTSSLHSRGQMLAFFYSLRARIKWRSHARGYSSRGPRLQYPRQFFLLSASNMTPLRIGPFPTAVQCQTHTDPSAQSFFAYASLILYLKRLIMPVFQLLPYLFNNATLRKRAGPVVPQIWDGKEEGKVRVKVARRMEGRKEGSVINPSPFSYTKSLL